MSDYQKKIKEADIDYLYVSTSPKGEVGSDYKKPNEIEYLKRLEDRINTLENHIRRSEKVIEWTLDQLGVPRNNKYTNQYLLCSAVLNGRVLLDNVEYGMVESVNGYINKMASGKVYPMAYLNQFQDLLNGCYQEVEDKIKLDEDKLNAMVGTL